MERNGRKHTGWFGGRGPNPDANPNPNPYPEGWAFAKIPKNSTRLKKVNNNVLCRICVRFVFVLRRTKRFVCPNQNVLWQGGGWEFWTRQYWIASSLGVDHPFFPKNIIHSKSNRMCPCDQRGSEESSTNLVLSYANYSAQQKHLHLSEFPPPSAVLLPTALFPATPCSPCSPQRPVRRPPPSSSHPDPDCVQRRKGDGGIEGGELCLIPHIHYLTPWRISLRIPPIFNRDVMCTGRGGQKFTHFFESKVYLRCNAFCFSPEFRGAVFWFLNNGITHGQVLLSARRQLFQSGLSHGISASGSKCAIGSRLFFCSSISPVSKHPTLFFVCGFCLLFSFTAFMHILILPLILYDTKTTSYFLPTSNSSQICSFFYGVWPNNEWRTCDQPVGMDLFMACLGWACYPDAYYCISIIHTIIVFFWHSFSTLYWEIF